MIIISDTNILSSLAAGNALFLLRKLFTHSKIYIPPAVEIELQQGLSHGKTHIQQVLQLIATGEIEIVPLTSREQQVSEALPAPLHEGEREGITLAQSRQALFLSNDKKAVHYCRQHQINVVNLPHFLRLCWTKQIISPAEVKQLISQMERVEKLALKPDQLAEIFQSSMKRK